MSIFLPQIVYHERKELKNSLNEDRIPESYLTLLRSIGQQTCTVKQIIVNGEVMDETTETNMVAEEFEAFKKEWLKKWRPAIGEGCTGVMTTFFEKLDKFVLTKDYEGLYN